ncbi:hypothetical protein HPB48_017403 [Haemaphysalis longicornis]|uniref:Endonuclease/exonuclease/phosphatase domain-containing protein n=1 Tax=Haemaphysalis longicornis TaxID=44386 RepID=A0A9J6GGU0_HAELO|nr:hypothetical protein HPB48_017403 [Haemaphysalis longicornis]
MGDLNAAHHSWGYKWANPRGTLLYRLNEDMYLTLIIDTTKRTKICTSSTRDTNSDLTFIKSVPHATGTNLNEYHGIDHGLLAATLHGLEYKVSAGLACLTDWTKLRETRAESQQSKEDHFSTIQEWIAQLSRDVKTHTKILQTSTITPCIDAFLNLCEARRSLLKR